MQCVDIQDIKKIEDLYFSWSKNGEGEKTLEVSCRMENVSFTVFFNRGCYIYPVPGPTPAVIPNSINLSTDDPKIRKVFEDYVTKTYRDNYCFPKDEDQCDGFDLRFFSNEAMMKKTLLELDREYGSMDTPRGMCNLM